VGEPLSEHTSFLSQILFIHFANFLLLGVLLEERVSDINFGHFEGNLRFNNFFIVSKDIIYVAKHLFLRLINHLFRDIFYH
jgi:hypothetical protein